MRSFKILFALALLLGLGLTATTAQADTILIQDVFETSPEWNNIVSSNKHTDIPADGSLVWSGSVGDGGNVWGIHLGELNFHDAYAQDHWGRRDVVSVPFSPVAGNVYTISVKSYNDTATDRGTLTLLDPTSGSTVGYDDPFPDGPDALAANQYLVGDYMPAESVILKSVLNTTGVQWTVDNYIDDVFMGTQNINMGRTISRVGIGAFNNGGSAIHRFDDFVVSVAAVPEPSTIALLACFGLVGLIGYIRRK